MIVEKKYLDRTSKRKVKEVKAIVLHWPGDSKIIPEIDALWDWMNNKSENSYHYFISKSRTMQTRDLTLRAIHCGHRTYRKKAKEFFGGNICSDKNSPNNYTLAVCIMQDNSNGSYNAETINTALDLLAFLCIKNNLNPETDILRHSDITNEKRIPCPKAFFEDDDDPDDLWNEFKKWVGASVYERTHGTDWEGELNAIKHRFIGGSVKESL